MVGGGARAIYGSGVGRLHVVLDRELSTSWVRYRWLVGSAEDRSDPTTMTVWAIGLRETLFKRATTRMSVSSLNLTSSPANHPCETFVIPNFYFITGVGPACANRGWEPSHCELPSGSPNSKCRGKDHIQADPSTITACAVGFVGWWKVALVPSQMALGFSPLKSQLICKLSCEIIQAI